MKRSLIVSQAKSYLGVPWKHQGRNRAGIDCVGLLIAVGKDLGMVPEEFDTPAYRITPDGTMLNYFDEHCTRVHRPNIKAGTLVVFSFFGSPYHAGIVTDPHSRAIIHAYAPARKVCADMLDHGQNGRAFVGAWDFRGVMDG